MHRFTALYTHLVWSTKYRQPFLTPEFASEVWAYLGGIVEGMGGRRIQIGGYRDHVHLLVDLPVTRSLADCVRHLKSDSSRWIHEKWPSRRDFAWQMGYGAFAVSRFGVEVVIHYIQNQEAHHRTKTYRSEFRGFLRDHGLRPDERYMWE